MKRFYSSILTKTIYRRHEYLFDLLHSIKEDPYQYLTSYSINSLSAFLDSYLILLREHKLLKEEEEKKFMDLIKWIEQKYGEESNYEWSANILYHSYDGMDAFNRFYIFLEEFQREGFLYENKEIVSKDTTQPNYSTPQIIVVKKYDKSEGFYKAIENIEKRPWLLQSSTLSSLCDYLAGLAQAKLDYEIPLTEEETHFMKFQEWISQRYSKFNQPWRKILILHSYDEGEALKKFFKLFKEFRGGVL